MRIGRLVALAGLAALLAGCSAQPSGAPAPSIASGAPSTAPTRSATPTPSAVPTAGPTVMPTATPEPVWRSPLDGEPGTGPSPVLVVKLDNTQYAQPHAGLTRADVVYIEEVEYGVTRLAAVFSGRVPSRIGPVRSARITDIDLLAQYGRPAFAYSGAQRKMFPVLDAARFFDVSPRTGGEGYSRDGGRRAPYNYFLDGRTALERAPRATLAQDMGFVFDDVPPDGGLLATSARLRWGYSSAQFDYRPKRGDYRVTLNGSPARAEEADDGVHAATVVIQYVRQRPSRYFDKGGGNTPHAQTIGTGTAVVLRDGRAWDVTWSRPTAEDGTTFSRPDGRPLPFKPGQVWIVLKDRTRPAKITPLSAPQVASPSPSATAAASADGNQ